MKFKEPKNSTYTKHLDQKMYLNKEMLLKLFQLKKNHYNYNQSTNYSLLVLKNQKMKFKELKNSTYIKHLDQKMYLNKEMLLKLLVLKKNHYNYNQLTNYSLLVLKNQKMKFKELKNSILSNNLDQKMYLNKEMLLKSLVLKKNHYNYNQLINYSLLELKNQKMKFKELKNLTYIKHQDLKMYLNKEMLLKL